ncbi:hypothetical protein M670_04114 [Schinkia azotoformans MEV2011]|uniref:Uncharacterized protein n=1 Tax=Schinkia azotoformans MEV2011 TaxID=1348973 RepID=A0A072NHH8_SCHAZ|nr:hypothetical protein [Schinkia azotoformans]KEF36697.1 hypothetical protein M670_04114 [Schinkia azotoformans MEV2011]MEC1695404.1 hypothetical protein [Schinkia azotoformans]MEC1724408.1 hypothetical protein [Schinkia azotoformans]MEC1742660.1 hypothetical protein [Schinkia azotoformans]MEC1767446.1 hypothetical protein [Schinkia azotoformans]
MIKNIKSLILSIIVVPIIGLSISNYQVSAAEQFYTKGWNNNSVIKDGTTGVQNNTGRDVVDITVAAWYGTGYGHTWVRGFSHNQNVIDFYRENFHDKNAQIWAGVRKVSIETKGNTTNTPPPSFLMGTTDPQKSTTDGSNIIWAANLAYDVLGLINVPTNTIAALVNQLNSYAGSGGVTVKGGSYATTVTQTAPISWNDSTFDWSKTELGIDNPWNNPDGLITGERKGMSTSFWYNLGAENTSFPMKSSVQIQYHVRAVSSNGVGYDWYPLAYTEKSYVVNAK